MDLVEGILTFRYKFFEETQPSKSVKDYKYFSDQLDALFKIT